MQKYEYKCALILGFSAATERALNQYAREGWELVCVWWAWHYLRRPVNY